MLEYSCVWLKGYLAECNFIMKFSSLFSWLIWLINQTESTPVDMSRCIIYALDTNRGSRFWRLTHMTERWWKPSIFINKQFQSIHIQRSVSLLPFIDSIRLGCEFFSPLFWVKTAPSTYGGDNKADLLGTSKVMSSFAMFSKVALTKILLTVCNYSISYLKERMVGVKEYS